MQTRTCFNGGEMSPELGARADLDAYMRGCRTVVNWELSEMGGVKRRRGMKGVRKGIPGGARLVPFIYSYAETNLRYLVMLSKGKLEVMGTDGGTLATFDTDMEVWKVRCLQINAMMLMLDGLHPVKELRVNEEGEWSFKDFEIEAPAWRFDNEKRDHGIRILDAGGGLYTVEFDEAEEELEKGGFAVGDELRLSFWLDQAEATARVDDILRGVKIVTQVEICAAGARFAMKGETVKTYWVCKQEFPTDVMVKGLDDPADYPDNFEEAEDLSGFDGAQVVSKLSDVKADGGKIAKNTVFILENGYWEYYTAVQAFTGLDIKEGITKFSDYPDFFTRGIPIGDALPCRGKWNFYCSGIWYGSYEVKKNYETGALNGVGEWETAGISFSRLGEGSNEQLTGDESDEECYLRLFITRSKRCSEFPRDGFPPEACGNRLIVAGYRHDMRLKVKSLDGGDGKPRFEEVTKVKAGHRGTAYSENWSWRAWNAKYGYPTCAAVCQQRLVFASTKDQPQTLWMSRVDDYTNFDTGDSDDSALNVTLYSMSQDPICWISEIRNQILLGTTEGEWTVGMPNTQLTPEKCIACKCDRIGSQGDLYLEVSTTVLFVERGSGRVYKCGYNYEIDGYRSEDLSVFAPHILQGKHGITQATLMRKPNKVAVFVLGDGTLALLTYNAQHEVQAWHRWNTEGMIYSVCALPNGEKADSLFVSIQRGANCWLEVVEETNDFVDNEGNDYTSELETNALMNPLEQKVERECKYPVAILFGCDVQKEMLRIKAYGTEWTGVAREAEVLVKGWHQLLTLNGWRYENSIALRYHGNSACEILALQG